ncbi:hypothetical protein [Streptosporangium carneum]|uniref:Uncharacterized protein n=1 Tax=Streptosporangium carneum TaxID=47481 RepID=A0A9W6I5A0_9ACTN|nr:hypothetical protein [Streptosporangium carneum]GLK11943.1 hypothetical protein GCM10017600_53510 [Streptosporangium carneum]
MAPETDPARRTRRHRTDWMALLSGLLFIVSGILFISVPDLEPLVMLPVVLGGLGLAGLVSILARAVRRQ